MRAIVARIASGLGHTVIGESATIEDARALAARCRPDAIALDGRLEGTADVAAFVRALALAAPDAAIFVIASLDEMPLVKRALAAGAHGAIRRPIVASQLRDTLALVRGDTA